MFEITIKGQVYNLNFGMGFLRAINKTVSIPVEGMPGIKKDIGLRYTVMKLYDGDIDTLESVIDLANKGQDTRVTRALLDEFIEDEDTDIEAVFEMVMGFLSKANATKKESLDVLNTIAAEKAKAEK